MSAPTGRTALYRFYDAHGQLLYVGISCDPDARWKAHRYEEPKEWCPLVASRTLEWLDSREEALAAEVIAIKSEKPRFNGTHNQDDAEFDPRAWPLVTGNTKYPQVVALMRGEIVTGAWAPGKRIPSLTTLGEAAGVSKSIVGKAAGHLKREGLLAFRAGHGLFVAELTMYDTPVRMPAKSKAFVKLPHDWCWSQLA